MEPERLTFSAIRSCSLEAYQDAKLLCVAQEKLAKAREQLTFNIKCKRNKLLPPSLRFRPPILTNEAKNIALATGFKYLECFIKNNHYRINQ